MNPVLLRIAAQIRLKHPMPRTMRIEPAAIMVKPWLSAACRELRARHVKRARCPILGEDRGEQRRSCRLLGLKVAKAGSARRRFQHPKEMEENFLSAARHEGPQGELTPFPFPASAVQTGRGQGTCTAPNSPGGRGSKAFPGTKGKDTILSRQRAPSWHSAPRLSGTTQKEGRRAAVVPATPLALLGPPKRLPSHAP